MLTATQREQDWETLLLIMINIGVLKETFARIFVIAVNNKMNLLSFSYQLERSEFIRKIEEGKYDIVHRTPFSSKFG